ncbi:MAG: hypothetical protein MK135_13560, partial [Polyangiaceae bacterium]|nr:hypothetical protein [Polyangiaceae bacterium]
MKISGSKWISLFFFFASSSACDLGQGLVDVGGALGNPEAALLDAPGRRLTEGDFSQLTIDGSQQNGGYVLALHETENGSEAWCQPYLNGAGCSVSPAVDFSRVSSKVDIELPGIFAVQEDRNAQGRGKIRFLDFDCQDVLPALENSSLPRIEFPQTTPRGVFSLGEDQSLNFIDPKNRIIEKIATKVTLARVADDYLYTIEGEQVVVRDENFKEILRAGEQVEDITTTGGSALTLAFRDTNGLSVWSPAFEEPKLVMQAGCGLETISSNAISTYSDCDTKTATIITTGANLLNVRTRLFALELGEGVPELNQLTLPSSSSDSRLYYIGRQLAGATSGELIMSRLTKDDLNRAVEEYSEEEANQYRIPHLKAKSESLRKAVVSRRGLFFEDWEGSVGTLLEITTKEEQPKIERVVTGVRPDWALAPFHPQGILAHYDEQTDLFELVVLSLQGEKIE